MAAIGRVTAAAFAGHPYSDGTEAAIVEALRDSGDLALSLVAEADGAIQGAPLAALRETLMGLFMQRVALHLSANEITAARKALAQALELDPENRILNFQNVLATAERNGGNGRAAIAPFVEQTDVERWPGAVVHHLAGRISQDEMLRAARKDKQMERLNLSEAWFYIGQRLLLAGDTESARRMFQRTVDIGALPYREHAFAQLELRRASAR